VTRLEPPYLLALLLLTAAWAYQRGIPAGFMAHLGASAVYLHNLAYHSMSWVDPVAWSLEIEIQFYLLAPLFAQTLRIRPAAARRGLLAAVIGVCGVLQTRYLWDSTVAVMTIAFYVQYFLGGLLLADVYTVEIQRIPSSWWWDLVAVSGWASVFLVERESRAMHVLLAFLFPVLCLAAVRSKGLRSFFANQWIAALGGMCYSIYLLHQQLISALFKQTRRLMIFHDSLADFLAQIVVTLIPAIALCSLYYLLVEQPCMDPAWPSKLWQRLSGSALRVRTALDATGIAEDAQA